MTAIELRNDTGTVQIDYQAILRTLKLNPTDPNAQALLVVCDRYGLDPILKQAVLIQGTLYVTRDGLLSVAHRSGAFDGIEVLDQGETDTHYTAKVAVYRKDMTRPFTYIGRYPKNGGNKAYGPEMAVKCAEVMALRRAFNVTGIAAREEQWDLDVDSEPVTQRPAAIEAALTLGPVDAKTAKSRLLNAVRSAGWAYKETSPGHPAPDCPAVLEAARIWNGRGDETISEADLATLTASVGEGSCGQVDNPAAGSSPTPTPTLHPDTSKTITKAQAQRLRKDLGRGVDTDGYGLASADQDDLIYVVTEGRTSHSSDLTVGEEALLRQFAGNIRDGRMTLGDVHRAAEEHRAKTMEGQLEQSLAGTDDSAAVRDFDERTGGQQ